MIDSAEFHHTLKQHGFNFFTGVADSTTKGWIEYVYREQEHVVAVNECEALAIASGYYLGSGKIACVYLQNAGLGKMVNPLTSLCDEKIYAIPALLVIGWRAEPGTSDEPQHKKMGEITCGLLDILGVPYKIVDENSFASDIFVAKNWMETKKTPFALIVRKGLMSEHDSIDTNDTKLWMTRESAIQIIADRLGETDVVIATTGKTSRELFEHRLRKGNNIGKDFYTVGSMGCASAIGFGVAYAQPHRRVVVFDGDGSLLMQFGSCATIGHYKLKNLVHIVFDNNAHDSTGGQQTVSNTVNFADVAKACGYSSYIVVHDQHSLVDSLSDVAFDGSRMIVVKINKGSRKNLGRPTSTPSENKIAFMNFLRS